MSWAVGYDVRWRRDVGYGVPAVCDYPGCGARIDRGLGYVCGGRPFGGDEGCGLFFCGDHLYFLARKAGPACERCDDGKDPFEPTPDLEEWTAHKMTHPSWAAWRAERRIPEPSRCPDRHTMTHRSPDCVALKHGACTGDGCCVEDDAMVPCPCSCHVPLAGRS